MALVTLQTIFQDAFSAYEQRHALPAHVRRAAHALMQCRTAALGGHIQACPDGHVARVWYNSCRHRSCPQCAYLQTERWLALHPWSQTLVLHPHVHCLVTGGGRTADGSWKAVRNGFLLPARVVMAVFRGKMLAAIRQALARAELELPEGMRPQQLLNLLHRLGHPRKTKWNVHIRERYQHGAGVVTYLARYVRGGPITNARLVAWDGERVTFTCRPRQEEADGGTPSPQRLTLAVADFLQRWLLHVPMPQTRVVRLYGLYHPSHTAALAVCRAELGQPPMEAPAALDWQTMCAQRGDAHPERCPTCGQRLVCTGVIPRGGAPPPVGAGARAA
jgi:hypothetical protein